jgi:peptide-methionine (S)-S-oxide reductase
MASETAILAGGCFWCLEASYLELQGVTKVQSGYIGGHAENPSYKAVCTGQTGHAEAVEITFDPAIISYDDLLKVFFTIHDPTTLNRQGNDAGTQYRSAIYFLNPEQEKSAHAAAAEFSKIWSGQIVTEITQPVCRLLPGGGRAESGEGSQVVFGSVEESSVGRADIFLKKSIQKTFGPLDRDLATPRAR